MAGAVPNFLKFKYKTVPMKKSLLVLILFAVFKFNAQHLKYQRVEIDLSKTSRQQLLAAGITIDHSYAHDNVLETEISELEVNVLAGKGIPYKVLIQDMALYYASRNAASQNEEERQASGGCNDPNLAVPSHFHLGSMGGYFTLSEMEQILDSMALLYPSLVKTKAPISSIQTHEGRNIWYVKLSDNPTVDENEPEVLYTALHHAREGASLSQLIYYMWYLLENYATDPQIKAVLNNTELFFIPCFNPDGYYYNETTNPGGGGMWRKNRRDNGDGSYGIDLNRNYGVNWGYDNNGSSNITTSDVYRGTGPFSEPETQAMKEFCEARHFKNALNAHTYSNVFIYPWGHVPDLQTADSTTFKKWGALLTRDSRFHFGTCNQTLGYETNGGADDWMYGEQATKSKIFSMTPESGTYYDGFWPVSGRIVDICKITFSQNLNLARLALNYAEINDRQDNFISPNGYLKFAATPLGLSPGTFTVKAVAAGTIFSSMGPAKVYNSILQNATILDSIAYSLVPGLAAGQQVQYSLTVDDGFSSLSQVVVKLAGSPVTLFYENGTLATDMDTLGQWELSTSYFVSPPSSITDSQFGDYQGGENKILVTDQVDLNNAVYAHLQFYTKFVIEKTFDNVTVSVSTNNGASYSPLCGKYSTPLSSFAGTTPLYDGRQEEWVKEEIDLSAYLNKKIRIRFSLTSDFYTEKDGFYLDDVLIRKIPKDFSGLAESGIDAEIAIHPNPSQGIFYVASGNENNIKISVFNAIGTKVADLNGNGNIAVDLTKNSDGVYFVCIEAENKHHVKKVVISR